MGGNIPLTRFDLSDSLRTEVAAWAAEWDQLMQTGYEWPSQERADAWWSTGRALAERVDSELGPSTSVTYHQPEP